MFLSKICKYVSKSKLLSFTKVSYDGATTLSITTLRITTFSINDTNNSRIECCYGECQVFNCYAEYHYGLRLNVILLSAARLNVILLSAVAPALAHLKNVRIALKSLPRANAISYLSRMTSFFPSLLASTNSVQ